MSDDGLIRMSGDATWNAGYEVGVQDSMLRATQIERVLTDLIEELREHVDGLDGLGYENFWDAQRDARDIADRAEARLREVTNE